MPCSRCHSGHVLRTYYRHAVLLQAYCALPCCCCRHTVHCRVLCSHCRVLCRGSRQTALFPIVGPDVVLSAGVPSCPLALLPSCPLALLPSPLACSRLACVVLACTRRACVQQGALIKHTTLCARRDVGVPSLSLYACVPSLSLYALVCLLVLVSSAGMLRLYECYDCT